MMNPFEVKRQSRFETIVEKRFPRVGGSEHSLSLTMEGAYHEKEHARHSGAVIA